MEYNENGQIPTNRRRRFFPTVSLGNIFTGLIILGSAIGMYATTLADVRENKVTIENIKQNVAKQEAEATQSRREIRDDIRDVKGEVKEVRETMQKILFELQRKPQAR